MLTGFSTLLTAGVISGCAVPMQAGADFDRDLNMGPYRSFAWAEPDEMPSGDARLDHNPFFTRRLHEAISTELSARGIRLNESDPALVIHHHTSVRDRVQVYEADRSSGYTDEDYGNTQIVEYEEGTFLVDIADANNNQILWRGWATVDIERALDDSSLMAGLIAEAVARMFERFPVEPGPR